MPDLNSLFVFAHVAESLSYSAAARRLGMPLSTVSRRVAELERELGASLLQRSTRHLRLTPVGMELLQVARRSVNIAHDVTELVSAYKEEVSGVVRFAAPPSISDSILTPLITGFQTLRPRVRFETMVSEQVIDHLGHRIDFEIHVGPIGNDALIMRRILRFRHQLVASPRYLALHGAPEEPADLRKHNVVAFSHSEPELIWKFEHATSHSLDQVSLLPVFAINDYAGVVAALLGDVGVGDLPPIVRPDLTRDGRLVRVMTDWQFPTYELVLIHPKNRYQTRAVALFKDFVARELPRLFPEHVG